MKDKRGIRSRLIKSFFLLAFVALMSVFHSFSVEVICRLALISAKSYLPQKGISSFLPEEDKKDAAEEKEIKQETSVPDTTNNAVKTVSVKNDDITALDSDLAELEKRAKEKSTSDKKDGDIYEYTFTDDGVTDSFGVVRVKNTNKTQLDIEQKLLEKLPLTSTGSEPMILIYHTHTTETYQLLDRDFYPQGFLSRSNDENLNMIRVGKAVKEQLEKMGYSVIHDTTVYDSTYSGAYYRSMDKAEEYLEQYPSIQITLDIHRDAIQDDEGTKTKPVATIGGRKAAQIMIITGCQEEGNGITDLPDWEKNLTFALKLQQSMESLYEGLTRPVFFCARSYNMSLTPMSLLIEVGTDANTVAEAVYSGKMLGSALGSLIEKTLSEEE